MTKKLTNLEMLNLYGLHKELSTVNLPFKFTIGQNLRTLEKSYSEYKDSQQKLHLEYVNVDENGNPSIKKDYLDKVTSLTTIPYQLFEYKDEEAEKTFFEELKKLNLNEVSVDILQESLNRNVRVKIKESEYLTVTLKEYLDEFCETINSNQISELLNFEVLI
jgi:small nuclear ribonucleoprotein (snRNP)-like protein